MSKTWFNKRVKSLIESTSFGLLYVVASETDTRHGQPSFVQDFFALAFLALAFTKQ